MTGASTQSPFRGLSAFEDSEYDALFFFGRERERAIVVANLVAARLTVLYGPSGVGKSSLLRAAVARSLRQLPEEPLVIVFSRWSDDPAAALAEAVTEALGGGRNGDALESLERAQSERDVYLVLDQAEEYFLYQGDDAGPRSFAETLPALLAAPQRLNVLISMREDALAKLDRFSGRIPGLFANTLRLDRLDREAARAAIVRPVERLAEITGVRVTVEAGLIERVLDAVGTGRIETALGGLGAVEAAADGAKIEAPYLQLVMQRIWDEEQAAGSDLLRAETLQRLGGARQIVDEHLESAMARLSISQKDLAAGLFNHLVTPSGTKIAHETSDLADFGDVPVDEVRPVLDVLSQRRILRSLEEGGDVRYEIFHDVLAQPVLAWRARHEAGRALMLEREVARRRQRRLLAVIAAASVLIALMAALTTYALTQRDEAQEKTALAEAARASALKQAAIARKQTGVARTQRGRAEAARRAALDNASEASRARADAERQRAQAVAAEEQAEYQAGVAEDEAARAEEEAARAEEEAARAQAAEDDAQLQAANARERAIEARTARTAADRSARRASARALAEEALTLLASRPLESLRLAVRSAEREATPLAERVLRTSLVSSRVRYVLPGGGGPVVDASFSRDARLVLTVADRARIFDVSTGSLVRAVPDPVNIGAAELSPDGRSVLTAGRDGKARIWPVAGGPPRVLAGHRRAVEHAVFSRDGRLIATAAADRTAILWTATGERRATFQHEGPVFRIEISPDTSLVLTVSTVASTGRRVARLFEARSGALVRNYDQGAITSAIFAPDGRYVVTTSRDDTARAWYHDETNARAVLRHSDGDVLSAAFSADGTRLVTATEGSSAVVWNAGTWEKEIGVVGPLNPATGASFNPSRRFIVVSSRDRNAHIFDAANGRRVAILTGHQEGLSVAEFSPTGRLLVTASADGSARIWDPGTEDLLEVVGATREGAMRRVSPSPNGRLAVSAGADGTARIFDVNRGRQLKVLHHDKPVNDAAFSPDGKNVLTASDDRTARLWRPDGAQVRVLAHGGRVLRAVYSPDGRLIATSADDRVVRIWRARDGRLVRLLRRHSGSVVDLAFSPNAKLLATAGDNADKTARIWRISGKELHALRHRGPVVRVVFSPDGQLLATASGDEIARLWDVNSGQLRRSLRGHSQFVRDVDFRSDGKVVVTASDDGDARTWSVSSGRRLNVLRGHFSSVQSARFSEDGRWIVTAGPRTAGLWDARTGEFFAPTGLADPFLRGPTRVPVTSAEFVPGSFRIVTSSGDGTVRTYACSICSRLNDLVDLARGRLRTLDGNLSRAERLRYLRA